MPKTEGDPLGPGFEWRLSTELNRVRPRWSSPRYLKAAPHRVGTWRLAPTGLVVGVIGILALSAFAATGSANPVVWERRIVTTIQPIVLPEVTPVSPVNPAPAQREVAPAPEPTSHEETPPKTQGTSESPEPSQRPSGGDDHSGSHESSGSAGD
jgi:hypothetical protein